MPTRRLLSVLLRAAAFALAAVVVRSNQNIVVSGDLAFLERKDMPVGTGVITGRVIEAASKRPIAGAVVYLNLQSGGTTDPVLTDDQGRFVFANLPKGTFTLRTAKAGFVAGAHGHRIPEPDGRIGQALELAEDQRLGDMTITMWRHAAIAGTVVDETGEPVVGVTVRALRRRMSAGRLQYDVSLGASTARTDDRGMYRLSSLMPGDYVVALPTLVSTRAKVATSIGVLSASLSESSGGAGRFGAGGSGVVGAAVEVGDAGYGILTGSNYNRAPGFAGVSKDGRLLGYELQFFPAAATIARASVITLQSGDERAGINFQMRPVPTSRISGTIAGSDGPPGELLLRLVSADTAALSSDPEIAQAISSADGRFTFLGVPPGEYTIRMNRLPRRAGPSLDAGTVVQTGGGASSITTFTSSASGLLPDTPTLFAETAITVANTDVDGVVVQIRKGARVSGRIEFQGAAPPPSFDRVSAVYIERADGIEPANYGLTLGRVDPKGNFNTYGQPPGKYFIRMTYAALPGWWFKGAMAGGRDVSVDPIDLADADINDVVIVFTDSPPTEISGTVRNERGPDTESNVVVFPSDRQRWTNAGVTPRTLQNIGVGADGRYRIVGLPPGDYIVAAVADADPAWADPRNLSSLATAGVRLRIADGDRKVQDLTVRRQARDPSDAVIERQPGPFVAAEDDQVPARDGQSATPSAGMGVLSGVVVSSGESSRPMRRAIVTITGTAVPGGRAIVTDDTGRFEFTRLPAGRYSLTASKAGFLDAAYGARQPGRPGTAISLTDGQTMRDIRLALTRGAVITGVIRDEHGEPVSEATVQALRYRTVNGDRRLMSSSLTSQRTDDRGVYRIFELEPGDYFIAATVRSTGNARVMTAADVENAMRALTRQERAAGSSPQTAPAARPRTVSYAPTFYPGADDIANATVVKIGPGEEKDGVDFVLRLVSTARIEGTVVNGTGPLPGNTEVRILNVNRPSGLTLSADILSILPQRVSSDGKFVFTGVAPGQYAIAAVSNAATGRGGGGGGAATSLWATAEVAVAGNDVSNLVLTLQPGMTVSGKVTFSATTLTPPALAGIRITMAPVLTGAQISVGQSGVSTAADGTFTVSGVMPGRYTIRAIPPAGTGTGWLMRSAMVGGRNVADEPFDLHAGDNTSIIDVTFTDQIAEISGVLQDASGRPAPEYFIILFATERAQWRSGSRRIQQVRPSSDGRFVLRGLLPGDYQLAALTDVEPGEWFDPEFLEKLVGASIKISLAEGEKKTQDIRIAR